MSNSQYQGSTKKLTIIVCTYNRDEILKECLESLAYQSVSSEYYDVLIIDNNSTDDTYKVARHFEKNLDHIRLVKELKKGLSHARNRGYLESKTPWVSYVDDDAKAYPNYVERALWVIDNYDFDCFGGMYYAWHKYGRPKWLPKDFGDKQQVQREVGIMKKGYASGGVIVFKKNVLEQLNGFPVDLGMKGKQISYGEETYLQIKMREQGFILGFDPELKIEHLVAKHKLRPWWHVKSRYKQGEVSWNTFGRDTVRPRSQTFIKKAFLEFIEALKNNTLKLKQDNYYFQNWFIDTVSPMAYQLGKARGLHKLKRKVRSS